MDSCEDNSMSNAQSKQVNEILNKIEGISRMIEAATAVEAEQVRPSNPDLARFVRSGSGVSPFMQGSRGFDSGGRYDQSVGNLSSGLVNLATNQPIAVYGSKQPMAGRNSDLRIGSSLFNWLRGENLKNEQVGGVDSSGGFLITPSMGPMIVDLARARSVAVRLGASSMQMDSPEVRIGTVTGDATPQWAGELQAVTASDVTFGLKTLRARKMVTLLFASDEWLMDASNGAALLENSLSKAMAAELDNAILSGSGAANEPEGITNNADRLSITSIGAIADYADPVNAIAQILAENYQGPISDLGFVLHPTIAGDYQLLTEATTNAPLAAPAWVNELRKEYTTSVGTGTAIVGDFSQVLIGTRMNGMRFEVLNAGTGLNSSSETLNAVTQSGRWIRMTWYGDSVVLRPTWFCTLEGITT